MLQPLYPQGKNLQLTGWEARLTTGGLDVAGKSKITFLADVKFQSLQLVGQSVY